MTSAETPGQCAPILIAGPTASGKSALALALARACDGLIINADALQVYDGWQILSARPDAQDTALAPHALYGHVPMHQAYSVGDWLRDLRPLLRGSGRRPIIVGGTGLYFSALTQGLAQIPPVAPEIRARGDRMRADGGAAAFAELARQDPETWATIDRANPARLQRAWEVLHSTGTGLRAWQARTGAPCLPLEHAQAYVLEMQVETLNQRIAQRFAKMLADGAPDELRRLIETGRYWPDRPSGKALGAPELALYIDGKITLQDAEINAIISTRQFAKRQRTWFRNRMGHWPRLDLSQNCNTDELVARILT